MDGQPTAVFEVGREVKSIQLYGASRQPTQLSKYLASALFEIREELSGNGILSTKGVELMQALVSAPDSDLAVVANDIYVSPLITEGNKKIFEDAKLDPANLTLGEVADSNDKFLKQFVFGLVATNAESIATEDGIIITEQQINEFKSKGEDISLIHTQRSPFVSMADRLAFSDINRDALGVAPFFIVDQFGNVTAFNQAFEIRDVVLRQEVRDSDFAETLNRNGMQYASITGRPSQALRGVDLSDHGLRAVVKDSLNLAGLIYESNLSPVQKNKVSHVIGLLAIGAINESGLDGYLKGINIPGINLKTLISQLSAQIRTLGQDSLPYRFAASGQTANMMQFQHRILQYNNVPGSISNTDSPVIDLALREMLTSLKVDYPDISSAEETLVRLEKVINSRGFGSDLRRKLSVMIGVHSSDFALTYIKALDESYLPLPTFRRFMSGDLRGLSEDEITTSYKTLFKLMMPTLASSMTGVSEFEITKSGVLDAWTIGVVEKSELSEHISAGESAVHLDNKYIEVGVELGRDADKGLIDAVKNFVHELGHVFTHDHDKLEALNVGLLGIPTSSLEKAANALFAHALKTNNLEEVAALGEYQSAKRQVQMKEAKALFVPFKSLSGMSNLEQLLRQSIVDAKKTNGINNFIPIVSENDMKDSASRALIERMVKAGLRVVRLEDLKNIPYPIGEKTPLAWYAENYLASSQVKLALFDVQTPRGVSVQLSRIRVFG